MPAYFRNTLAILLSGVIITACGGGGSGDGWSDNAPPSSGSLSGALTAQATDIGTLPTNPDILGRDEAYSASFGGYSVWIYGDTAFQNPDASARTFVSNSWSYTSDLNGPPTTATFSERHDSVGSPSMLLQETPTEYAYNLAHYGDPTCQTPPCGARYAIWPSTIVTDPASGHALVFYSVLTIDPDGTFHGQGASVAIWSSFDQLPQRPVFNPAIVPGYPDLMFGQSEPGFGSSAVIAGGYLYVYGCHHEDDGADKTCDVARVSPDAIQNKGTWTYYAGNGTWSTSVGDVVPVFTGLDIMSVSWNPYLQRYIAVYNQLFTQNVVMRTAPAPEGPWSDELTLFKSKLNSDGSKVYDAQAHSEFDANGGQTIYVTYTNSSSSASVIRVVQVNLQITGQLP